MILMSMRASRVRDLSSGTLLLLTPYDHLKSIGRQALQEDLEGLPSDDPWSIIGTLVSLICPEALIVLGRFSAFNGEARSRSPKGGAGTRTLSRRSHDRSRERKQC